MPSFRDKASTKEAAANSAMMWMSGPGRHIKYPTAHPMMSITAMMYKRLLNIMRQA